MDSFSKVIKHTKTIIDAVLIKSVMVVKSDSKFRFSMLGWLGAYDNTLRTKNE